MNRFVIIITVIVFFAPIEGQSFKYSECKQKFDANVLRSESLDCFTNVYNNNKNLIVQIDSARYITSICLKETNNKDFASRCSFKQSIEAFEKIKLNSEFTLYYEAKYYAAVSHYTRGRINNDVKQVDLSIDYFKDVLTHRDNLIDTPPFLIYMYMANAYYYKAEHQNAYDYYQDAILALKESDKLAFEPKYKIAIEKIMFNASKNFADAVVKKCKNTKEKEVCSKCGLAKGIYKELKDQNKYKNVADVYKKDISIEYLESICTKNDVK